MQLTIEYMPLSELKAYSNNAKIHTEEQIEQIKKSIQEFGMNDPIAIWKNNEIIEGHGRLRTKNIQSVDRVFEAMLDFLDQSKASSVALAQGGDFVGGVEGRWYKRILRKAMNSFFCRTDRRFKFFGAVNEDVNTYVSLGNKGQLFLTELLASLHQKETQQAEGGMSEAYLDFGTYVKSFYTVMVCPSCVKVSVMGNKDMRVHHKIMWKYAVPKIISDKWRK